MRPHARQKCRLLLIACIVLLFAGVTTASLGDHLPEFRECVEVRSQSGDMQQSIGLKEKRYRTAKRPIAVRMD